MNLPSENATAPRERKRMSHEETRVALLEAIARLRCGNPQRVDRGTGITVSSVAREADVHRTTIHNHHTDIVVHIIISHDSTTIIIVTNFIWQCHYQDHRQQRKNQPKRPRR